MKTTWKTFEETGRLGRSKSIEDKKEPTRCHRYRCLFSLS